MMKVGISGKIASGKSEVEKILTQKGYVVIDLDVISHKLLEEDKEVKNQILTIFQTLNRKEIGKIVFANENKKKELEEIIYPKLKDFIFSCFEKYKNEKAIFISGALLFNSEFYKFFDKTIFIDADENLRLERLIKRNNLTKEEALKRLNLQDESKLADFIIENNDNLETLKINIEKALEKLAIL